MTQAMYRALLGAMMGGATPELWTPAEIGSGLNLWLDASDSSTITITSGRVSQWNDKSGDSRNASQGTSTKRPTVSAAALNGLDVLNFDTDDHLATGATSMHNFVGWSAFAVARRANSTGLAAIFAQDNTSPSRFAWYLYTNDSTPVTNCFNTTPTSFNANAPAITVTNWNIYGGIANPASGGTLTGYTNGFAGTPTSSVGTPNSGTLEITIGARLLGTPLQPWNGDIAEIVCIGAPVSSTNREKIEGYLAHKWGQSGLLDSGHPYKSTPPYV